MIDPLFSSLFGYVIFMGDLQKYVAPKAGIPKKDNSKGQDTNWVIAMGTHSRDVPDRPFKKPTQRETHPRKVSRQTRPAPLAVHGLGIRRLCHDSAAVRARRGAVLADLSRSKEGTLKRTTKAPENRDQPTKDPQKIGEEISCF